MRSISFMTTERSCHPSLPSPRCFLGLQEMSDQERWQLKVSRWKRGIDSGVSECQRGWNHKAQQQQAEMTVMTPLVTKTLCLIPLDFSRSCSIISQPILFHTPVGQESSIFNHLLLSSQNFFLSVMFNPISPFSSFALPMLLNKFVVWLSFSFLIPTELGLSFLFLKGPESQCRTLKIWLILFLQWVFYFFTELSL